MKIYNSITIDMNTLKVVAEDSFEYNGPVALCVSSSSSSNNSSQQMMDPEAARRMAAVAERSAAMGEEQWQYYLSTFKPYEEALAQSNQRMIAPQEEFTTAGLKAQTELMPYRTEVSKQALTSIQDELSASRPVVSKFYEEALHGVNVDNRMAQAGADVAQGFDASIGQMNRNMSRMGVNANNPDVMTDSMSKFGMARAKASAAAMTGARTNAENENFSRLAQGMQARQGAIGIGATTTPYESGNPNQGGFQLQAASNTALGAYGNAIGANQAGMGTLTTSSGSGRGWGIL